MLLISPPKVTVSQQPVLRWAYKMDAVKDGEETPIAEVLPELAAQTVKAASVHCSETEGGLLRWGLSVWYQHKHSLTFRVQERKKIWLFLIQNILKSLASQLDWVPRSQALHPKSDKMQLFRWSFKRQNLIRDSSSSEGLCLHPAE